MNLAAFLAVALAAAAPEANPPEELFRVVLTRAAVETGQGRLCVEINKGDPSEGLLWSVDPRRTLLIPASECEYVGSRWEHRAVEKETGRSAQFLTIEVLSFTPESRATVDVGYRAGSWQGYGYTYTMLFESGEWHFKGFDSRWVE